MIQDLNYQRISKPHEKNNDDYASVSILIHDEKEIIFIKRSEDLPTHKGHIAFPGGKKEVEDQSIVDTAVREACEELLIDSKTITPIGILKSIDTVEYKFEVYPVVCLISDKPSSFNKSEVQNLYYVPIQELEKEKKRYPVNGYIWYKKVGKNLFFPAKIAIDTRWGEFLCLIKEKE